MSRSRHAVTEVKERLLSVIKQDIVEKDGGAVLEMDVPGVPRTVFNRQWVPSPHVLSLLVEQVRPYVISTARKVSATFGPEKKTSLIVTQTLDYTPACYDVTMTTPLRFRSYIGSFSDKVVNSHIDMMHGGTGALLIHNEKRVTYVRGSPIRSLSIPPEGRRLLEEAGIPERAAPRVEVPPTPDEAFRYAVRAGASDTDHIYHVNQAAYLRYCLDAAYEAARAGRLPSFPPRRDIAGARLRHAACVFRAESFAGDELEAAVWESAPYTLHVVITRRPSGTPVYLSNMLYYPWSSQAKL